MHYGWLHFSGFSIHPWNPGDEASPASIDFGGWVDSWAWESEPGKAIVAGAVPEPSAGLLVLPAVGLLARRRRSRP